MRYTALNCGISLSENMAAAVIEILLKYNTQANYREHEITSDTIFSEILAQWHISVDLDTIKKGFYSFFQADAQPYPDAADTLIALQQAGIKIGVLTDVAYGFDRYDAWACMSCLEWEEPACGDPKCPFCSIRPQTPYEAYHLNDVEAGSAEQKKRWRRDNYQHKTNGMIKHHSQRQQYDLWKESTMV